MLNEVKLIGHLGADPESRTFSNGNGVCNLRIACTEKWTDKNTGERKEMTEWVNVALFSEGLIKVAQQYLKKGSKVFVSGKLRTRKYEKNGQDHYATEVVLQGFDGKLIMLDGAQGGQSNGQQTSAQWNQSQNSGSYGSGSQSGGHDDLDDPDIPF